MYQKIERKSVQQTGKVLIFPISFLITENLWQGYKSFLHHNKLLVLQCLNLHWGKKTNTIKFWLHRQWKRQMPQHRWLDTYSFVPCTDTLHWFQSSNRNSPEHQNMLDSPSSPSLLLPTLVQPEFRFSQFPSGKTSTAYFTVICIIPPSHKSVKFWKLLSKAYFIVIYIIPPSHRSMEFWKLLLKISK